METPQNAPTNKRGTFTWKWIQEKSRDWNTYICKYTYFFDDNDEFLERALTEEDIEVSTACE